MQQNKNVVVIGGGTGLSTMLRGLKKYTTSITAIVTVADNGGGSGKLREEMGMIAPGDIRNCILALANTEPIMKKLLQYRFTEGSLNGQNFGNLFLAALTDITGGFEEAVRVTSNVLAITGKVLPVTLENVNLKARFSNGICIAGETQIVDYGKSTNANIIDISLEPKNPEPAPEVKEALMDADIIILGPGSLYTSVIPNLLVNNVSKYIKESRAKKIYISNLMTQPGETKSSKIERHVEVLESYLGKDIINKVIINSENIDISYLMQYEEEGSQVLKVDETHSIWDNIERVEYPLVKINEDKKYIRHDANKLAKCIFETE